MPHAYTEDQLVEQPAIGLFAELGWKTVSAMEEVFGAGGTLGRETKGETVLVPRLRQALEQLKAAIAAQLNKLIRLNKTRADYLAKFEELIESYNAGSRNIDDLFQELLNLTRALSEEQQRHVRENLSEEELTVFDLLTRPGPDLSAEESEEVKKVAKLMMQRLNVLLVLDWRRRNDARAKVRLAIEDALDEGLPRAYTPEVYQQKCSVLFEHVFEAHAGKSTAAA